MVYLFKNVSRGGFLASKVSHPFKNMLKANSERDYKILRKRHGCCKLLLENYTFETYKDNKSNQADSDKITYRISGSLLPSHTFETCQDGTNDLIENDKDDNKSSNCCGLLIQNYTFGTYSSSNSDKDNKNESYSENNKGNDMHNNNNSNDQIERNDLRHRRPGAVLSEREKIFLKPQLKKEMIWENMREYNML